jgi:hypothetical protein
MDTLFLGVSHVVPCGVLWIFGRKPKRTHGGTPAGKRVYEKHVGRS